MLALWEYFWTEADWVPAPPPPAPPAPQADENRGSGKGRGQFVWDFGADEEFWRIREEYLQRQFPKPAPRPKSSEVEEEAPEPEDVVQKLAEKDNVYLKAQRAKTRREFEMHAAKMAELASQIESLRAQYDEEAIILLLLL